MPLRTSKNASPEAIEKLAMLNMIQKKRLIELESAIDESLAIIAHIDPDTYNHSTAIRMISDELLKTIR